MYKNFSFTGAKKIVFGNGSLGSLGEHIREFKATRPLIVLDRKLGKTDLKGKVLDILNGDGLKATLFDQQVE
ncbi:MAG: iron-containing alcohol dehydrogenase, partial [Syntrophales bacterium]